MKEREKLIDKIYALKDEYDKDELTGKSFEEYIADLIIADRKRIVEPLVKERSRPDTHLIDALEAINETLRNAGVEP